MAITFPTVILFSAAWIALCLVVGAALLFLRVRWMMRGLRRSGTGGLGAVSFGLSDPWLLVALLPPLVLFVVWLWTTMSGRAA